MRREASVLWQPPYPAEMHGVEASTAGHQAVGPPKTAALKGRLRQCTAGLANALLPCLLAAA